jgi:hypothetical protein
MSPLLLLIVLVAALIAMIPVWRLRAAGWPRRWLFVAWLLYGVGIFAAVRAPAASRFLLPILVLAYVAPFVAGPERLTRVLRGRGEPPRPIVNVTPHPPVSLPPPRDPLDGDDVVDDAGPGDDVRDDR